MRINIIPASPRHLGLVLLTLLVVLLLVAGSAQACSLPASYSVQADAASQLLATSAQGISAIL